MGPSDFPVHQNQHEGSANLQKKSERLSGARTTLITFPMRPSHARTTQSRAHALPKSYQVALTLLQQRGRRTPSIRTRPHRSRARFRALCVFSPCSSIFSSRSPHSRQRQRFVVRAAIRARPPPHSALGPPRRRSRRLGAPRRAQRAARARLGRPSPPSARGIHPISNPNLKTSPSSSLL